MVSPPQFYNDITTSYNVIIIMILKIVNYYLYIYL